MGLLEYLKKILGDEEGQKAYDKIQADKDNVILVDSKKESKYVEKGKIDSANQTIKDYKQQIKDRDTQLNDLKEKLKDIKDVKELESEIEKLKTENQQTTEKYESKLKQIEFDTKFEKALTSHKPKNTRALKALLDMEKIKLDGDSILGLDDQMKVLKESDAYLFEDEKSDKGGGTGVIGGQDKKDAPTETIGARLAKQKAENQKNIENEFFKIN
ncbi:phage scaffolding protein [Clostridium ganghwense]|uniref:Phage scaffolding protein n=1 Tax=Clostridium ganghwense TaxID=312089 RepID=A0ABT4CTU3_9CLOT|nr:phage scaffolding protein [Clostridium ganghwense]MCY6372457.1 phage scaffolding protein [Clostridium ganghwense]